MNESAVHQTPKFRLEEYLDMITTKKGNQYICPLCGSGTGKNKTPAGSVTADKQYYHCFSCGFHGDIYNLVGKVEGLIDNADIFRRTYEIFNLQVGQPKKANIVRADVRPAAELPAFDYTAYYNECHARASETDYFSFRRLSQTTIERFNLGFDPAWRSPKALLEGKNPPAFPRIIIPTSKHSYVAHLTDPAADQKFKIVKEGRAELFNRESLWGIEPTFIVEGEIDALSIMEAGGEALALGSISNKNKLTELCGVTPPLAQLVLCLDNDDRGRKTQAELKNALGGLNISVFEANLCGAYKDPNEYLMKDRASFLQAVQNAKISALQYAHEAAEAKKLKIEAERVKYINMNSIEAYKAVFQDGIKASMNTSEIPTGFTELDKVLDDGLYEGLYILGAISSLGKTSFVLQAADQIARQGYDVLFFSLEMSRAELVAKSISRITFTKCGGNAGNAKTARGIMTGKRYLSYSQTERELIDASTDEYFSYAGNHLYISEGIGDIGVVQVREMTEQHIKMTGNKPVVMIDYLQILSPVDMRASDKQNTDKAVFELKRMSRDLKIPVVGISSLNRASYNSSISMESYKESGAVEYSSDCLIGLQFESAELNAENINRMKRQSPRKIELKVLKNRNGATGDSITYDYYPMFNYFKETGKKIIEESTVTFKREKKEHR